MDEFEIKGSSGSIKIELVEVIGYPNNTHFDGGYDCNMKIAINVEDYSANSSFYATTNNLIKLRDDILQCYQMLDGEVIFFHRDSNLKMNLNFLKQGGVHIYGSFQKFLSIDNVLSFEFYSDQTFVKETLNQMTFLDKYKA
ncbi:WapI family immunity protein [Winogradskyella ouciana]|uniref:Immunity protein 50 n=1 Tax=Winogradskyella ouciana TaxID=2608631 RepID=A0A7K1GFM3_9FLAO|nr:hypothetical protein [Winogradskyella ouciana]MTE27274.1 hypothetical protein [Winogradskyella ouciana]